MIRARRSLFVSSLAAAVALFFIPSLKADTPLERGQKFLKENSTKKGVHTSPSGLQYLELREGVGRYPGATDTVEVHYRGTLISGVEFDSSYKRGKPSEFPLDAVIKGWTEGLHLMREGAKFRLFIPSELAYGAAGSGKNIGPDETLIFDVELLRVK